MAVYTEITDTEVREFADEYDVGEVVSLIGIAEGVENSNYLLLTDRDRYILTLYEKRVRPQDLPFFLGLMEHLSNHGIACPMPVRARDGVALRELAGRPAVIVTFLRGVWPRRIWPDQCRALGGALAALHLAGRNYDGWRANDQSIAAWRAMYDRLAVDADRVSPGLAAELAAEVAALEAAWPRDLPTGLIHADLFPDNVFFVGDEVSGVIDFYFSCNDFFAYDVAICLNAWCFEPDGAFNATKARQLLSAYRRVRPFSDAELIHLPILCRGAAIRFLLTRLHDWLHTPESALVERKDPIEYLHKLRFHQQVVRPGEYGLD